MKKLAAFMVAVAVLCCCARVKDGNYRITAVSTQGETRIVSGPEKLWPLVSEAVTFAALGGRPAVTYTEDSLCTVDAGSWFRNSGLAEVNFTVSGGKVSARSVRGELLSLRPSRSRDALAELYPREVAVADSLLDLPIGSLDRSLDVLASFCGQSPYMDFYHAIALSQPDVRISLAAPLALKGELPAWDISLRSVASLYPFENQLVVLRLSGEEILRYLEESYAGWVDDPAGGHALLLSLKGRKWNFAKSPSNFDSAGGLCYSVDLLAPKGERVKVSSLAGGEDFEPDAVYNVAITTYRAAGSGGLLKAAGLDPKDMEDRIVRRGPLFRTLLLDLVREKGELSAAWYSDPALVGSWTFLPEGSDQMFRHDLSLIGSE